MHHGLSGSYSFDALVQMPCPAFAVREFSGALVVAGHYSHCAYSAWFVRIRRSTLMTANLHHRILATLTRRYEQRIMNNVCRSDYVECMVASVLGADWRLTWADGRDWAPRDCEHT